MIEEDEVLDVVVVHAVEDKEVDWMKQWPALGLVIHHGVSPLAAHEPEARLPTVHDT